jgi:hypothetical protein
MIVLDPLTGHQKTWFADVLAEAHRMCMDSSVEGENLNAE